MHSYTHKTNRDCLTEGIVSKNIGMIETVLNRNKAHNFNRALLKLNANMYKQLDNYIKNKE